VFSPYVLALAVSALITAGFAAVTWRRRPEPGTTALSILLVAVLFWAGCYGLALVTTDAGTRALLERAVWIGSAPAPVAWLVFALQYTGQSELVTRRTVGALSVPPAVVIALAFTNDWHHLVWTNTTSVQREGVVLFVQSYGPAFWAYVAFGYTLVLAGMVLLLRLVLTADHLFADQALALLIGALVPLVANLLSLAGVAPLPGLDLTPYAFAVSAGTFAYALYQSELLQRVPATRRIGRNAVVTNMRDGVVVLDDSDVVVDVNPVAEGLFECDRAAVVGEPAGALFDDDFEIPDEEDTVVWSGPGPRVYEVSVSLLTDQHDRGVGRVLVVRDITNRTNRRQQLQVLNRVLRHNFRNDMNVIDVCATQLSDRLDDENEELADRIRMVARDLTETGMKAREIERIMSRRHNDPQPIDLPGLVQRLVDTIRHEYPEVRVETDLPDRLEIRSTGILESVLQNVLENAVIHNDDPEPRIGITVDRAGDGDETEIRVADNGPGIPDQEREVLVKGTETPLEHGSGLGLWLVNWGVTMLDGEVSFADRAETGTPLVAGDPAGDPRGSVVTIRVPRQHRLPPQGPPPTPYGD
jgi:signal transduction histidine kinase